MVRNEAYRAGSRPSGQVNPKAIETMRENRSTNCQPWISMLRLHWAVGIRARI